MISMIIKRIVHPKQYNLKIKENIKKIDTIILRLRYIKPKIEKLVQQLIKESKASKKCPDCHSKNITKIIYGLPIFDKEPERDNNIYGGCCIGPLSPVYHCRECNKEWNVDYTAIQEYNSLIEKYLSHYNNINKLNLINLQQFLKDLISLQNKITRESFNFEPLREIING